MHNAHSHTYIPDSAAACRKKIKDYRKTNAKIIYARYKVTKI